MNELKDYHFTDEQIDQLLRLVRDKAFQAKHKPHAYNVHYDYNELANLIEDQIVNHPKND